MNESMTIFSEIFRVSSVPTIVVTIKNEINDIENDDRDKINKQFQQENVDIICMNESFKKLFNLKRNNYLENSKEEKFTIFLKELYQYINYININKNNLYDFFYKDRFGDCLKFKVIVDLVDLYKKKYAISVYDYSDSLKTELILKEFIEKHYLLLKYINDSIVLFKINDFSVVEFNDNFKKLIGEFIELNNISIYDIVNKNDIILIADFLDKKIKGTYDDDKKINLFLSIKNKYKIPVEINIFFSSFEKNNIAQLVIRDLRNQFELEEGKKILATAVDQAAESIMITDIQGNIQYVNPAFEKISGYTLQEVLGKNPKFLQSGQTPHHTYKIMLNEINNGRVWRGILINRRKSGEIYKEEATITPVKNHDKIITNFVAVKRDITHNLMLEEQVRQSQKMQAIGTLAGGIAHDFNNILTAIMGYAELSQEQCDRNSIIYNNLSEIIKGTDRASHLVDQILKFSRKSVKNVTSINLDIVVKEVLTLIKASISANVNILYENQKEFYIKGDPTQLHQIIMNLCTNAYQALEGKYGSIFIRIFKKELSQKKGIEIGNLPKGSYICLQIEDTGIGIPKEYQHRIFEPFFTTKKLHEGTGLGLSVVHGIVNDHGGAVTVESSPGKGSCFTIYFPESKKSEKVSKEKSNPARKTHHGYILVIDDEKPITDFISQVLKHLGYKVESCISSKTAQKLFEQKKYDFDIVITDMGMPEMTGLELTQKIKAINPAIQVILCTGYSEHVTEDNYQKMGLAGFLPKPFNAEQLVKEVTRVMQMNPLMSSH